MNKFKMSDYLIHHGVKGMKWGVRKDPNKPTLSRDQRKMLKDSYKKNDRNLTAQQARQWKSYINSAQDAEQKTRDYIKGEKVKYKSGEITKDEYKQNKNRMISAKLDFERRQEYNMAIAQYHVERVRSMNKQVYIGAVKGKNSKAYKYGEQHLKKNIESWGNYTIQKTEDGSFRVTRTDYYYY